MSDPPLIPRQRRVNGLPATGAMALPVLASLPEQTRHKPTKRQTAFRSVADTLTIMGFGMLRDWMMFTAGLLRDVALRAEEHGIELPSWPGDPVNISEWRGWLRRDEDFERWFYDGLSMPTRFTQRDLDSLDAAFFDKLRTGILDSTSKDHAAFMVMYARMQRYDRPPEKEAQSSIVLVTGGINGAEHAAAWLGVAATGDPPNEPSAIGTEHVLTLADDSRR